TRLATVFWTVPLLTNDAVVQATHVTSPFCASNVALLVTVAVVCTLKPLGAFMVVLPLSVSGRFSVSGPLVNDALPLATVVVPVPAIEPPLQRKLLVVSRFPVPTIEPPIMAKFAALTLVRRLSVPAAILNV